MPGRAPHPRLPEPPASLDAEAVAKLERLVTAALKEQRRLTAQAVERTFDHVPRLLRAPVRKILGV